ncbi:hypothetical protein FBU30_005811 [Linnemannia zychae]|nr:hypothetical protein FBU30_005811 [Linnemannia zychae]
MELTRQQLNETLDHISGGFVNSLETPRIESLVTLDELVRFFDVFDNLWDQSQRDKIIQHATPTITTTSTTSKDNNVLTSIFSTPLNIDSYRRKYHALSVLEPRLIDCSEIEMSSSYTTNGWQILLSLTRYLSQHDNLTFDLDLSDAQISSTISSASIAISSPSVLSPHAIIRPSEETWNEKFWPQQGTLVSVTIVSLEELCSLWEHVLNRSPITQQTHAGWPTNPEHCENAIQALTVLQKRWMQMITDRRPDADPRDFTNISHSKNVEKILSLLKLLKDKVTEQEGLDTLSYISPQELELSLDLRPSAGLGLVLSLDLDLEHNLEQTSDKTLDQVTIQHRQPNFENTHKDDGLYDPNEWFVSPEEVPAPRDLIIVNKPKSPHPISPSPDRPLDQAGMAHNATPIDNHSCEIVLDAHNPPTVQLPRSTSGIQSIEKSKREGPLPDWLEKLWEHQEQQEHGRQQMQQQIEKLQEQLKSVQLQYDKQCELLTTLEQKQESQCQLRNQFEEWIEHSEQMERGRQEQMEDMQEQLLWQQQQLSNWEDLRQEGTWVQQSDFERLESQFDQLCQYQRLQEDVGVKQTDFERLETQINLLKRQQKQLQPSQNLTTASPSISNSNQQQMPPNFTGHKKFRQLIIDHQKLKTKYRHLKQEFDRQTEKQRRQWERQQQIEQLVVRNHEVIQGHKQQVRQLHSDQMTQSEQYLRRIDKLEGLLADMQGSHKSLVSISPYSVEKPKLVSSESESILSSSPQTSPTNGNPLSKPSSSKQQAQPSSPQHSPTSGKLIKMMRSKSKSHGDSNCNSGIPSQSHSQSNTENISDDPISNHNTKSTRNSDEGDTESDSNTTVRNKTSSQSTIINETRPIRRSKRHKDFEGTFESLDGTDLVKGRSGLNFRSRNSPSRKLGDLFLKQKQNRAGYRFKKTAISKGKAIVDGTDEKKD